MGTRHTPMPVRQQVKDMNKKKNELAIKSETQNIVTELASQLSWSHFIEVK